MQKKVFLVAGDHLQSKIHSQLSDLLQKQRYRTLTRLRNGRKETITDEEIMRAVEQSDLVIVNTSDLSEEEALAGKLAVTRDIPLAMSSDGYGCWSNPAFMVLRKHVRLLFVVDEEDRAAALPHFPNAEVVATGSPEWEEFAFPSVTREDIRKRLGIEEGKIMILGVGEKDPSLNMPLFVSIIEGIAHSNNLTENCRLIIGLHPGDQSPPEIYDMLPNYTPGVSVRVLRKGDGHWMPTRDMLMGADVVIGTNSTVLVGATLLRIPAIANLLRGAFRGHQGVPSWPPCDRGAIQVIHGVSSHMMGTTIEKLTQRCDRTCENMPEVWKMAEAAERYYPRPTRRGQALELMAQGVARLLGQ